MEKITKRNLINRLARQKAATPISLVTKTVGKDGKEKIARRTGFIGFSYENSVNNQRKREAKSADFKPKSRAWGKRIQGTALVEHDGKVYVELKQTSVLVYTGENDEPAKQHQQGLDDDVILRDINVDNVIEMRYGGRVYAVC